MRGNPRGHGVGADGGITGHPERKAAAGSGPRGTQGPRRADDGTPEARAPAEGRSPVLALPTAARVALVAPGDGHDYRKLAARERWRRQGVTERELEVWELAAKGLSHAKIGQALSIARATVRKHVEHLYAKTEVHTGNELTVLAWQEGLAGPDDAAVEGSAVEVEAVAVGHLRHMT